jgi:hypothetical protein
MQKLSLRRALAVVALGVAALGGMSLARPAQAAPADFIGNWVNIDPTTRDIVRLRVGGPASALKVQVFGACSPTPCDWGLAGLITYGDNVSDPDHKYGTAAYAFGFKQTALTFQLIDSNTLVVHDYNRFTDGSGRQNYHDRGVFKRVILAPPPHLVPIVPLARP